MCRTRNSNGNESVLVANTVNTLERDEGEDIWYSLELASTQTLMTEETNDISDSKTRKPRCHTAVPAGNVLLAGEENMGDLPRAVGALCGVDFDTGESQVVDHFQAVQTELLGEAGGTG